MKKIDFKTFKEEEIQELIDEKIKLEISCGEFAGTDK